MGVVGNGGPLIPFRPGRVDTQEPGPATVPEPQQDLATHTEDFRKQGFSPTEMIALVACGHTLGGVRGQDFDIVPPANDTFNGFEGFDNTDAYDDKVFVLILSVGR
jgi:catalase (peroxidase I)